MDEEEKDNLIYFNSEVINKIKEALVKASPYGSVEIYVQDKLITQITYKHIEKTSVRLVEKNFRNTLETDRFGRIIPRSIK